MEVQGLCTRRRVVGELTGPTGFLRELETSVLTCLHLENSLGQCCTILKVQFGASTQCDPVFSLQLCRWLEQGFVLPFLGEPVIEPKSLELAKLTAFC